uniref:Uncharacterized protein n=1 Tax=viral metagenome TaxID=1070528 RepID=A0A6M3XCB5_9ZZZZ
MKPFSDEDAELLKEYRPNQIVKSKLYGDVKPRSMIQLAKYWVLCGKLGEMLSEGDTRYSKDDIDFEVKTTVAKEHPALIKRFKMIDGALYIEPISISFANMKHLEATNFFNLAYPVMSKLAGITKEQLMEL